MQPLWQLTAMHTRAHREKIGRHAQLLSPTNPLRAAGDDRWGAARLIGKDCPASPLSQLSGYPNLLILWGKFLKSPQFPNETTTGREVIISIYSAQIDYKLLPAPKIAIYGNLIQSRLIRDINNTIIFSTRKITTNF